MTMAAATTLLVGSCAFADEKTEKTVAFRTTTALEGAKRYITMAPYGGLNASSKDIAARQVFALIDLNGGDLTEGDAIQIKYAPADGKASYWHEGESVIDRVNKLDDACTFKIKLKEKSDKAGPTTIALQTASGKFISVTSRAEPLSTTDSQDKAIVLEIVENPTPKAP
jgi:hypothetical protein